MMSLPSKTIPLNLLDKSASIVATKREAQHSEKPENEEGRRVSFDESRNVSYSNTVLFADQCGSQWYTIYERHQFQQNNSLRSKSLQRQDDLYEDELGPYTGFRCGLTTPYELIRIRCEQHQNSAISNSGRPKRRASTGSRRTTAQADWTTVLTDEQLEEWSQLYRDHPDRLGLEAGALPRLTQDRFARHHTLLNAMESLLVLNRRSLIVVDNDSDSEDEEVHLAQKSSPQLPSQSPWEGFDNDARADLVRTVCERISLPSRAYAHEWALAVHQSCMESSTRKQTEPTAAPTQPQAPSGGQQLQRRRSCDQTHLRQFFRPLRRLSSSRLQPPRLPLN